MTGMNKVCRIAYHRTIDPQPLMVPSTPGTLRLMEAAGKPLQPNVTRTGHLLAAGNRLAVFLLHGAGGSFYSDRYDRGCVCPTVSSVFGSRLVNFSQ